MKDELVTFETAKLAKEKEFTLNSLASYVSIDGDKDNIQLDYAWAEVNEFEFTQEDIKCSDENNCPAYLAPTQSLLQKWLREKHNIIVEVNVNRLLCNSYNIMLLKINPIINSKDSDREAVEVLIEDYPYYETYEKALEKGLKEALKLIETKISTE